ncbi:MAG: acyltransferase [Lachnospiraceae bacterium]|nr:acyltransferase [Lachnospiraceae bacterium]
MKVKDIYGLRKTGFAILSSPIFELRILKGIRWWGYHCLFDMGKNVYLQYGMHFFNPHPLKNADLIIGNGVSLGAGIRIDYSGGVEICDHASLSDGAVIYSHDHSRSKKKKWIGTNGNVVEFYHVTIDQHAWIGANAVILPRVTRIGKSAVIAAGAVVRNNVPDGAIVAGNPARIVGYREI